MENPKRISHVQAEAIGDGMGIFDPQQGQSYILNATTALVWQHCDGQTTPQQLAERIEQKFNVTPDQANQLMQLALNELAEANLLAESVPQQPIYSRRQLITTFMVAGLSLALLPIVTRSQADAQDTTSTTTGNEIFEFTGFFPPVANEGFNVVKAGRAIPIKFSLNGDQGLDIFEDGFPKSQEISCDNSTSTNYIAETETTETAGGSTLSYDPESDQYTYVWKTDKGWEGTCREFTIQLMGGEEYSALFSFT